MSSAATPIAFCYMVTMSGAIRHGGAKSSKGYAMAQDYDINIKVKGLGAAANQLADFTDELNKAREEGASISGALDTATGGAVTGFRKAAAGTKTFITGLKLTRAAIIATGIGALVVGVTALVGAFTKTRRGARQLQTIMAGLGAVVEQLTARFQAVGGFIVDLFSKGPQEAVKQYKQTLDELPGSLQEAINKAVELEKRTQALTDAQRALTVQRAKDRAEIKALNMVAEDTTKRLEEREAAAQRAIDIEKALMAERERIAAEELAIAQEKAAQSDSSDEDLNRLAELEANLLNLRTESVELQTTLNNKLNTIRNQAAAEAEAEAKRIADAALAKRKAEEDAAQKIADAEAEVIKALKDARLAREDERTREEAAALAAFEDRKEKAKNNADLLLQVEEEYRETLIAIDDKYQAQERAKEEEANKQRAEAEKAVADFLAEQNRTAREQEAFALEEHYNSLAEQAGENATLAAEVEQARLDARREMYERFYDEDQAANKKNNEEKQAQDEAAAMATLELRTQTASQTFSILTNLNEAFSKKGEQANKKAFQRNKAIGIAETLVSTYLSAQKAYLSQLTATPDSPIRAVLAAAAATASGLARVAAIKSTQFNSTSAAGGGGGGGGGGIGGGTQSVGVDVGSLIPNQDTPTPEPVRAYVVENEISNKQALNRELQIQTTL